MCGGEKMIIAFKYRIHPNKKQQLKIDRTITTCRILYNDFLEEREYMYNHDKTNISYRWQQDSLPFRKKINPYLREVHSQVLQDVARRVDKTYQNFFRRSKNDENPGYPRYKSARRYNSFTYSQSGFSIEDNKLKLSQI